ncbi:hypothetical protein CAPTEDRAFT_214003 [Capitella teleta]|uniref:Uncharacterized protein n=1 Tax=Capitella teleta TaxID=283909 RepID=R7TL88_CAPTE|nr:hypothetical protein CAPTEDRAFT_214003 [Capitella teleta]|eukprot:ELT94277.1 hypothetical protein CAPTEDRAFT_214003 [Capitella teleta]
MVVMTTWNGQHPGVIQIHVFSNQSIARLNHDGGVRLTDAPPLSAASLDHSPSPDLTRKQTDESEVWRLQQSVWFLKTAKIAQISSVLDIKDYCTGYASISDTVSLKYPVGYFNNISADDSASGYTILDDAWFDYGGLVAGFVYY